MTSLKLAVFNQTLQRQLDLIAHNNAALLAKAGGVGISKREIRKECLKIHQNTSDFSELNQLAMSRAEFVLRQLCDGDVVSLIERLDGGFSRTSAAILLGHMQGCEFGEVLQ
jgi:hypothetical protein